MENNSTPPQSDAPAPSVAPPEPRPTLLNPESRPIAPVVSRTPESTAPVSPEPLVSPDVSLASESAAVPTSPSGSSDNSGLAPTVPTSISADPTLEPEPETNTKSPASSEPTKPAKVSVLSRLKAHKLVAALIVTAIMGTVIGTVSAWTYQAGKIKDLRASEARLMREKQVLHNDFEDYRRDYPAASDTTNQ